MPSCTVPRDVPLEAVHSRIVTLNRNCSASSRSVLTPLAAPLWGASNGAESQMRYHATADDPPPLVCRSNAAWPKFPPPEACAQRAHPDLQTGHNRLGHFRVTRVTTPGPIRFAERKPHCQLSAT